jgi:hypothetical protein
MSVHEAFEFEQSEMNPETHEMFEFEQPELHESHEYEHPSGELHESLELELAHELLEITNEAELEEFLGKLVRRVARGASSFMKSSVGRAVGGVLRSVAKTALPMVGSALGSFVAPGLGTAIGGQLGSMASKLLEAEEREMMGEAEAELEAARRYVRWAGGTVRNAMRAPYGVPPRTIARSAAVSSARSYAPRLLRPTSGARTSQWRSRRQGLGPAAWDPAVYQPVHTCSCGGVPGGFQPFDGSDDSPQPDSFESHEAHEAHEVGALGGRWFRRGNRIVLVGA